jgi:phosphodiester glycosidase
MARQFLSAALATAILLAFSLAFASSQAPTKAQVGATLQVIDGGRWRQLQKGVASRTVAMERSQPAYTVDLKLLRFDGQVIAPRVLSASDLKLPSASAKIFAEKTGAIAAINANYFDAKGRPLAYLKILGKEINHAVSKHSLYTGIFAIGESGPLVIHRDDFQPAQASEGLQSGPLLLHHGATAALTGDTARYARRSVIGIDEQGRIIIGVTDAVVGGLSFAELQELFINPRWQIGTTDLLNLDGGGSAQLYIKSGGFEEWLPGTSEVPVAIGFFTKPN